MQKLYEPYLYYDAKAELGECPRWHATERSLYWVDIAQNQMHCTDQDSSTTETLRLDNPVACFAFRKNGGLVLGMKDGCALIDHLDDTPRPFGPQVLADKPHHRFNDGRTDAAGRFWIGSMNGAKDVADATLYRLDPDATLTPIESGMMTCNGAAFSADGAQFPTRFAHADTPSHAVRIYDFDAASGVLADMRILHQFENGKGRPDGGSFDADGNYWTALFDGGRVVQIAPDGQILREVRLPVSRPTMIAFGGDDLRTAYVTSARIGLDAAALAEQPLAGGIFTFRVKIPGLAEHPFAA
jgi:sugar lactone lactonase YvrE